MLFLKIRLFDLLPLSVQTNLFRGLPTPASLSSVRSNPMPRAVVEYRRWWTSRRDYLSTQHERRRDAHQAVIQEIDKSRRSYDGLIYL